jgi:hypothetical protein
MSLKTGTAGLALLLAAGCTPGAPQGPAPEGVAAQAALERLMGMETCTQASAGYGGMQPELAPCRISLGEGKPSLVVTSTPMIESGEGPAGQIRVETRGAGGLSLQVIEETALYAFNYPYVEDLTADGLPDLMVPLMTGNVNTSYALWLQGADGRFVRAGELGGVSIGRTPEGFIAASGRSSAAEWETGYFRVTNGALEEVAGVVNRAGPEPGEAPLTQPPCEVIRVAEGVDPAPFCQAVPALPG